MTNFVYFVRGAKHASLCQASIESVRRIERHARVIVMTDEREHSWRVDGSIHYIDSGMPIMLANLEAQVAGLFIGDPEQPFYFLDTDILLLGLPPIMGDITITWRDHVGISEEGEKIPGIAEQMPYNYGVIGAQFCRPTVEAFIYMRERIRRMHYNSQQWYGNQLALASLAGRREGEFDLTYRTIPWAFTSFGTQVHVGKIPCEKFNYTPQGPDEDISEKVVLHFKGGSRALMGHYAKRLGLGWREAA